ncbi:MAG: hypothetical protein H7Z14_01670 [Anaerolineae bacterium]|nr:hypothetical protein [Phycisphaerae bacterium]
MHLFVRPPRQARQELNCQFESLETRRLLSAVIKGAKLSPPKLDTTSLDLPRLPAPTFADLTKTPALSTLPPPSAPPSGPIDPVAEYEPMEALTISWMGTTAQKTMLAQIAKRVTVEAAGRMYIAVSGTGTSTVANATTSLNTQGADLNKVTFFTAPIDTIWSRDYGPRYVYEGDVRVIADHKYNRVRPNDDLLPYAIGTLKNQEVYEQDFKSNASGEVQADRL